MERHGKGKTEMTDQIAAELNCADWLITNVVEHSGYVWFNLNGAAYSAKLSRGKFLEKNMRRD